MDARIAGMIAVVKVAVDLIKMQFPALSGRTTQYVVLVLSVLGGLYAAGITDVQECLTATGAIFAGAVAADQVLKREP